MNQLNKAEIVFEKYAALNPSHKKLKKVIERIRSHPGLFLALPVGAVLTGGALLSGKAVKDNTEEQIPSVKKYTKNLDPGNIVN